MVNQSTPDNGSERIPGASPACLRTRRRSCYLYLWGTLLSQRPSRICPMSIMIRTDECTVKWRHQPSGGALWIVSVTSLPFQAINTIDRSTGVICNMMQQYKPACIPTQGCDGSLGHALPPHWSLMGRPSTLFYASCTVYYLWLSFTAPSPHPCSPTPRHKARNSLSALVNVL